MACDLHTSFHTVLATFHVDAPTVAHGYRAAPAAPAQKGGGKKFATGLDDIAHFLEKISGG